MIHELTTVVQGYKEKCTWFMLQKMIINSGRAKIAEQTYLAKILHDFLNQTGKEKLTLRCGLLFLNVSRNGNNNNNYYNNNNNDDDDDDDDEKKKNNNNNNNNNNSNSNCNSNNNNNDNINDNNNNNKTLLRNKIQILHIYRKIQKFCNNNDDNLNKKRQYCIMYTTFDERRLWDVSNFLKNSGQSLKLSKK